MKTIEDLRDLVRECGMSSRPEYYSGRGATLSDLNSEILLKIQKRIKEVFGDKEAKAFVQMVKTLKTLSATTFLQELYILHSRDWQTKPNGVNDACGVVIPKDDDGNYNIAGGMFGMLAAMTHDGRDDTRQIRAQFLRSNGIRSEELDYDDMPLVYRNKYK